VTGPRLTGALAAIALLAAALAWLAQKPGLAQLDMLAYDRMLPLAAQPPSADILIVAIDEPSLAALGRWPWPRGTHARLLSRLADAGAAKVLLDLFLTEPSVDAREDQRLAQAMGRLPVYLPMMAERDLRAPEAGQQGFQRPLPLFEAQARGVGHAELVLDADGVARNLFLRMGPAGGLQPYVGMLVAGRSSSAEAGREDASGWRYADRMRIAYAGASGSYDRVSYVRVLDGEVPPARLRGRTVLVGGTAPGLGDQVFAPASARAGLLPGVEVHANAIDQLMQGRAIHELPAPALAAWIAAVLALAAGLLRWQPGVGLVMVAAVAGGCVAVSVAALYGFGWWLPAATPLAGLALLYAGWSWLRLRGQLRFLANKASALQAVPAGIFEIVAAPAAGAGPQPPKEALDRAIQRTLRLQALTESALRAMPTGVLLCDPLGRVVGCNAAAVRWLGGAAAGGDAADAQPFRGRQLADLLAPLRRQARGAAAADVQRAPAWLAALAGEYATARGQHLQLLAAPVAAPAGQAPPGYIVVLADLTSEREAQRQREKWNRFLSHDLRSPQVAILGLLDLDEGRSVAAPMAASIRREVQRTLALAEDFLDVSHAWMGSYRVAPTHVATVMLDVRDQVWAAARRAGVSVELRFDEEEAEDVEAPLDGALVVRALVNLVLNAVAHSPSGSAVRLCCAFDAQWVFVSIADDGAGMAPAVLQRLLSGSGEAAPGPVRSDGVTRSHGLGFEFARTVVARHGGCIEGWSAPGGGCTLCIGLPRGA